MEFGPKRGNVVYIFENFVKDFGLLILALAISLITRDFKLIFENLPVMVVVVFGPIAKVFSYIFTLYSIDEEKLIINSGFLTKKHIEIPLSTITTVDFTQNIIHQIFGVYRLSVDNASNISSDETKVKMTFSKEDALLVKQLLLKGKAGIDGLNLYSDGQEEKQESDAIYTVDTKDIVIMGLLKSKMIFFLGLVGVACSGFAIVASMFPDQTIGLGKVIMNIAESGNLAYTLIVLSIILFILAIICGAVGTFVKYYGFIIRDTGESLKIEYGLLTKKNFTIHKKKITGFFYEQSLFMRLFKIGVLRIFAIGYAESSSQEASEDPILLPLLREENLIGEMARLIPEMAHSESYVKPERKSIRYFFYSVALLISIIITIGCAIGETYVEYLSNFWIIGVILIVLSVAGIIMKYKNAGIYGNEYNISISNGGFRKSTYFIKTNNIESITRINSVWKEKKGVTSISVGYIAPLIYANQVAKNISVKAFDEIKSKLIY